VHFQDQDQHAQKSVLPYYCPSDMHKTLNFSVCMLSAFTSHGIGNLAMIMELQNNNIVTRSVFNAESIGGGLMF